MNNTVNNAETIEGVIREAFEAYVESLSLYIGPKSPMLISLIIDMPSN